MTKMKGQETIVMSRMGNPLSSTGEKTGVETKQGRYAETR